VAALILALALPVRAIDDQMITEAVSGELMADPGVEAHMIDVSTDNGVVTLKGDVDNILARERATRIAETVKGVRTVVNTVTVRPTGRSDETIRQDIENALLSDPVAEEWEIEVVVENGVATMTGSVDSWQEHEIAAKVVKGVRGVRDVVNDVEIDYDTDRSDMALQQEIESALRWDVLVDDALVDVTVEDAVAMLAGTVGSSSERTEAIADAWVTGIAEVDAENLEVASWARDDRFRKQKYVTRENVEVEEAVRDALVGDPRVMLFDITVDVEGGVATLRGIVDNLKAKRAAAQDASNTVGVWRVKNEIVVRPPEPVVDAQLEADVEAALLRDPYVSEHEISVDATGGLVELSGIVDSYFEKSQAEDITSRIVGVVSVDNNLVVDDAAGVMVYDPHVDVDWYIPEFAWYSYPDLNTTATDWEILEDVQDELFWSPFVESEDISVTVDNGVVNLTGTVDTWAERQTAEANALEAGAVAVDNDLVVLFGPEYYRP
jgi:osmotically-inducible protein OsmY